MSSHNLPLSTCPAFRVETIRLLAETVHDALSAAVVQARSGGQRIDARGNRFDLPGSCLWACSYGMPLRLRFPDGRAWRVQFRRGGAGAVYTQRKVLHVDASCSTVHASTSEVDFGADYVQVVWRVTPELLVQKLAALTGSAIVQRLDISPVLPLGTPQAQAMLHTLDALLTLSETPARALARIMATELESAMLVGLLFSAQHQYRELLDRAAPTAAPWQVSRAEAFIAAHWDKPIQIEDIVAATGASARSVFRAFRQSRGCTPGQFVKQIRLQHARRLLRDTAQNLSVTEVALLCGFADLSGFSKEFARVFGTPPSYERREKSLVSSGPNKTPQRATSPKRPPRYN